jgi:hypothetical protein
MMRLIEIAAKENYDEFKVEINSKLEVIFDQKIYIMTDDDIIDPNDPINTSSEVQEEKRSENSSLNPIRPTELCSKPNPASPKQAFFNNQIAPGQHSNFMYIQP